MASAKTITSQTGWRGVVLVAVTYIYFLIFAQFAFLQRLGQLGIADAHLKGVMAAMAFGGILSSLFLPRVQILASARQRLQVAFTLCAAAAFLTLLTLTLPESIGVAFFIGVSLGSLTVTLVTHLGSWMGSRNQLFKVGMGTGLGYYCCNFPPLFTAAAQTQSIAAAAICLCAVFLVAETGSEFAETPVFVYGNSSDRSWPRGSSQNPAFPMILVAFTSLIWLDSAAFFIIQNSPTLKAGTWQGTAHLYLNGALHLLAALFSAYLLRQRGLSNTLVAAFLALAAACLLLLDPHRAFLASLFYPVGVSLYSVALVAYPAMLSNAETIAERGRRAGWIYAVGGWFGSAMGIGMAQNLGHIPPSFIIAAGAVILVPIISKTRRREIVSAGALLLVAAAAWAVQRAFVGAPRALNQVERGRQVYISEGCINCHSQYVRPNTADVLMWGPAQTVADLRTQRPPLLGNRRQGPDLSEIAIRRSPLWLRAHFDQPSEISHGSIMPSFGFLFRTQQGDDLITYLGALHSNPSATALHRADQQTWLPAAASFVAASPDRGHRLYKQECATCHDANGATLSRWRTSFQRLPTNLSIGPYLDLSAASTPSQRRTQLARIIKFGISNTDMAGHEYLSEADVASLTLYLQQIIPDPITTATYESQGEYK